MQDLDDTSETASGERPPVADAREEFLLAALGVAVLFGDDEA